MTFVHRLWEEGWKQRYYKTKFDVDATDDEFRKKVVQSYVEGLCWVLRYYYQVSHWYTHLNYCLQASLDQLFFMMSSINWVFHSVGLVPSRYYYNFVNT